MQYWIDERRRNPGPNLFSMIVKAKIDGQPLPKERTLGMLQNVLFGKLDTVSAGAASEERKLAPVNLRMQSYFHYSRTPTAHGE